MSLTILEFFKIIEPVCKDLRLTLCWMKFHFFILVVLFASLMTYVFPVQTQNIDFRGSSGKSLVIREESDSPAWAAYRDNQLPPTFEEAQDTHSSPIRLIAGQKVVFKPQMLKWMKRDLSVKKNNIFPLLSNNRYQRLNGLKISQKDLVVPTKTLLASSGNTRLMSFIKPAFSVVNNANIQKIPTRSGVPIIVKKDVDSSQVQNDLLTPSYKDYVLQGRIELQDGMAYIPGSMHFSLWQENEEQVISQGKIDPEKALFSITVKDLVGRLKVKLEDSAGLVIGDGSVNLAESIIPMSDKWNDLIIKILPLPVGLVARTLSAYSMGALPMPLPGVQVSIWDLKDRAYKSDKNGYVKDADFLPGSNFLLKANKKKGFWGSLVQAVAGQRTDILMFPDTLVQSLMDLSGQCQSSEEKKQGIIWGRIIQSGKPVEGVHLELAEETRNHRPIYFRDDLFMPDNQLEATSRNGYFAFVGVPAGVQSVRAIVNNRPLSAAVLATQNQYVSWVEFDLSLQSSSLDVQLNIDHIGESHQPFSKGPSPTNDPLPISEVNILGKNQVYNLNFGTLTELSSVLSGVLNWMEVIPLQEQYELLRLNFSKGSSAAPLQVPVVSSEWLRNLVLTQKIPIDQNRGLIIGYVDQVHPHSPETDYQVSFLKEEKNEVGGIKTLYFDSKKEVIREGSFGKLGGGFVLFNVPEGFQSVLISRVPTQPEEPVPRFSQLVISSPDRVSVIPSIQL